MSESREARIAGAQRVLAWGLVVLLFLALIAFFSCQVVVVSGRT